MKKEFKFNKGRHIYTLDGSPMMGVTSVLGIISKPALISWAANMASDYVFKNLKDINDLELVCKEARTAHNKARDKAGDKGTDVHALVEEYIKECIAKGGYALPKIGEALKGEIDPMLNEFITWALKNAVQFLESEKRIYSEEWFVAGTADFTCIIDNQHFVGDLKTMKTMWDRTPFFQTAAYMKMLVEQGEEKYDGTIIVNINKETNKLTEYKSYDWEADIKSFEAALQLYKTIKI